MVLTYHGSSAPRPSGGRQQGAASGVSANGNALSHRPGDIPGTTKYCPASMCVPPAIHTAVSQRAPGAALAPRPAQRAAAEAAAEAAAAAAGTHYRAAFTVDPSHDYSVDPRVRRGAAAAPATASMGLSEQPRLPPTTYQAELLGRRDGGGCDGAGAAGVRQPGVSASAPTSPTMPRPGWLTTAQAAQLPLAELAAAAASRSAGSSPTAAAAAQPACAPRAQSASAYRAALASGAGARECLTEGPLLSRASPPRRGAQPPPPKDAVLMQALDQHSRGRVPGCTTYKPRGGAQVALEPAPPSRATTWGAASQQALRCPAPPADASRAIDSRKGLLSFFSASGSAGGAGGAGFVSENGLAEAARFHEAVRPLEGRMKVPQAPRTAPRGAPFTG